MPTLSELSSIMLLFIIIWDLWLISQKCKELEQVQIVNMGIVPKKKKEQEEPQIDLRFYRLKNFEKKKQKFLQSIEPYEVIPQPEYQVRVKKAMPIKAKRPLTYTELQPEIEKKVKVQEVQLPVMELVKQPIIKPQIVEVPKLELKVPEEKVNPTQIEFFQPQVQKITQDVPLFKPSATPVVPIMSSIFGNAPMQPTPQPPVLFGGNTNQTKQDEHVVEARKVSIFGNDNDVQQSFEAYNEPLKQKEQIQSPKNIFHQPEPELNKNILGSTSMPAPQTQISFSNLQTQQPETEVQKAIPLSLPPQQSSTSLFGNSIVAQPNPPEPAQDQSVQQTPLFGNQSQKKLGLFSQFGIKATNTPSQQPEQQSTLFPQLKQQSSLGTNASINIGLQPVGQGILFGTSNPIMTQQPQTQQPTQGTSLFGNLSQGLGTQAQTQQPQSGGIFSTSMTQNPQQSQVFGTLGQNPSSSALSLQPSLFGQKPGGSLFG